jgi:CHASE3 domain sensor protein
LLLVSLVRFLILKKKKKNMPVRLFSLALKNENNGRLEEAVNTYESALVEVKKIRFHNDLQKKITEKLKVLNTMIEYDRNCHFMR